MKLLKEIRDKKIQKKEIFKIRKASRAVLFDKNDLIPMLFVSKYNYYKLPGGGIEDNEDKTKALVREVFEETGSKIKVTGEVGRIIEFRSKYNLKQISYCYIGRIISKGRPNFTEKELSEGFKIVWLSLKDAISEVKNNKPKNYEGFFIQKRDIVFLKKVKQMLKVN